MTKKAAGALWLAILRHSSDLESLASAGNSPSREPRGRFLLLEKALDKSEKALVEEFACSTGWRPVRIGGEELWKLERVR